MIQFNLEAVVPFFVSSAGYGLLWDNYAWTYLNQPQTALVKPIEGQGQSGQVEFQAGVDGDYFFHVGRPVWQQVVTSRKVATCCD